MKCPDHIFDVKKNSEVYKNFQGVIPKFWKPPIMNFLLTTEEIVICSVGDIAHFSQKKCIYRRILLIKPTINTERMANRFPVYKARLPKNKIKLLLTSREKMDLKSFYNSN